MLVLGFTLICVEHRILEGVEHVRVGELLDFAEPLALGSLGLHVVLPEETILLAGGRGGEKTLDEAAGMTCLRL